MLYILWANSNALVFNCYLQQVLFPPKTEDACRHLNESLVLEFYRICEEVEQYLLYPSPVKLKQREILLHVGDVALNINFPVHLHHLHHMHNFEHGRGDRTWRIGRNKMAVLNKSLVQQVICMEQDHLTRNKDDVSHFPLFWSEMPH